MAQKAVLHLDIVIYNEENEWIAHCLQLDLVTTGKSSRDAYNDMRDVIKAHIESAVENDNWEHIFKSAPLEAWNRMFDLQRKGISPIVEMEELEVPSLHLSTVEVQSLAYAA